MTTFEQDRAKVGELMDGHIRLKKAYDAAEKLVADYPGKALAWFEINLVVAISNRGPGVIAGADKYLARARKCPDFTNEIHGDMLRDKAIGIARFCHGNELSNAEPIIMTIVRELHEGDENRLACATGVSGRLCAARGDHRAAVKLFRDADDWWGRLGPKKTDVGWLQRNWIEWLRSEVFLRGTNSKEAKKLFERIERGGGNMRRAKMIMKPGVGLAADHYFITHR